MHRPMPRSEPKWWTPGRGPRPEISRGVNCGLLGPCPIGPSCCVVEPTYPCCPECCIEACCYGDCGKIPVCCCCGPELGDFCPDCDCRLASGLSRDCCDICDCCGTCECTRYVGCTCGVCKCVCLYYPVCLWPCGPSLCPSCCVEDRLTVDGRLVPAYDPDAPAAEEMSERTSLTEAR